MRSLQTTALVVGGGPVGLLTARLLGRRGVATLVAEKHAGRLAAPKAHAINPRTLEICAAAGLPVAQLQALATPCEEGRHVRMVETLAGREIGVLPYERQDEAVRAVTPWPLINIAQPRFESVLEAGLEGLDGVALRRGLEWRSCLQLGDAVVSTLRDTATDEAVEVRSRWLIAADGAGSRVRESLGIAMDGPDGLAHNMMIHFEADLRALVGERPAILYFLLGPGVGGVLIAYDIGRSWVLMQPCRPDETPEAFGDDRARACVTAAVGAAVPDLAILDVRPWTMSAQVARRYRDGRIFLVGDAAHRFPPTGGLGLNTGVADADNLAWKLAAVEAGWGAPAILDSYEEERKTVARTNLGQSVANALRMPALFNALGRDGEGRVERETFESRLTDPAARAAVDAAVEYQRDHFDSLRLQLGYVYGPAGKADEALPISRFEPRTVEGGRLPHALLADGGSSLDLVLQDGFTLITAAPDAWRGPVAASGAPVRIVSAAALTEAPAATRALLRLEGDGALLVRPDGHILAMAASAGSADATRLLQAAAAWIRQPLDEVA